MPSPLLTLLTLHDFEVGQAVRVKRHGYLKHYDASIISFECSDQPDTPWYVVMDFGGYTVRTMIGSDYSVVARADVAWELIPHPQSDEWAALCEVIREEIDDEVSSMADVEPARWVNIPDSLKQALGLDTGC